MHLKIRTYPLGKSLHNFTEISLTYKHPYYRVFGWHNGYYSRGNDCWVWTRIWILANDEGDYPRLNASETPLLKDIRCIINDTNRLFSLTKYQIDEAEFAMKYGRILDLLKVPILSSSIKALTYFWDTDYRRITFWSVDMTPTIEEYSVLTEFPEDAHKVYFH
jgi:hypothetical protein